MNFSRKNRFNFRYTILLVLGVLIFNSASNSLYAQKTKKDRIRLNIQYVKIMDGEIYFDIKASARIKKKTVKISNINLILYNELEEEKIKLGETTTNMDGESRFFLKNMNEIRLDSSNTYNILVSFKGNDHYKKAKKSIQFKNANIKAKIITKDSVNYISATLSEPSSKEPVADESLTVYIQRLFKPLRIGEEFNSTDDQGSILVPIDDGIPGVDGKLGIEVVLNESDDYGTVKAVVYAPIGIPIVDESTFDQRTMWSPRTKTPIFLLIFPNLLIFGIWGFIIYLIFNLFKLSKS